MSHRRGTADWLDNRTVAADILVAVVVVVVVEVVVVGSLLRLVAENSWQHWLRMQLPRTKALHKVQAVVGDTLLAVVVAGILVAVVDNLAVVVVGTLAVVVVADNSVVAVVVEDIPQVLRRDRNLRQRLPQMLHQQTKVHCFAKEGKPRHHHHQDTGQHRGKLEGLYQRNLHQPVDTRVGQEDKLPLLPLLGCRNRYLVPVVVAADSQGCSEEGIHNHLLLLRDTFFFF